MLGSRTLGFQVEEFRDVGFSGSKAQWFRVQGLGFEAMALRACGDRLCLVLVKLDLSYMAPDY